MNAFVCAAEAPSNIALIKYMGKQSGVERNLPTNASLSLTLPNLVTRVEIFKNTTSSEDEWGSLKGDRWLRTELSERGRQRFVEHFRYLKKKMEIQGVFSLRSASNFPADCGIASSASSFAALTLATYKLAQAQQPGFETSLQQLAEWSRLGSGSSIRSFLGPLVRWDAQGIHVEDVLKSQFIHKVVVVSHKTKEVSSSQAHERIASSLLFQGRPERAEARLKDLLAAFKADDWRKAYELVWAEFWDMHALFATAMPPFSYMSAESLRVLQVIENFWKTHQDGPLVTMDAGANVHLIFRDDQKKVAADVQVSLENEFRILGHA